MKSYGKQRETEDERRCEGSKLKGKSGSVGQVPDFSGEVGTYKIATTRTDSYRTNSFIDRESSDKRVAGKLISQLIKEAEYQLAYYEDQASILRKRVKELKDFYETTIDNE